MRRSNFVTTSHGHLVCSPGAYCMPTIAPNSVRIANSVSLTVKSDSDARSEEHTSELQSLAYLVCRLLLEKKKNRPTLIHDYDIPLSQHILHRRHVLAYQ